LGVWIATCAGAGYAPVAPGTAGSLVGLVVVIALRQAGLAPAWAAATLAALAVCAFGVGVWGAGRAEQFFGRVDPRPVVIDEAAGQMLTFLARPQPSWKWLLAGFLLFRAFDVIKPFPARRAEKFPGGWGIMMDDVFAAAYSLAALSLLGWVFK
jgi:phosphatidylglycerophosphatase A